MNHFVISSNPADVYRARDWFDDGNKEVDWISAKKNPLEVGDIVYIYEVVPNRGGRGGIVYKTKVVQTGLTIRIKFDDRFYWVGGNYPHYIDEKTTFNRLEVIGIPMNGLLSLSELKEFGFHPPINGAQLIKFDSSLLHFIEKSFQ